MMGTDLVCSVTNCHEAGLSQEAGANKLKKSVFELLAGTPYDTAFNNASLVALGGNVSKGNISREKKCLRFKFPFALVLK